MTSSDQPLLEAPVGAAGVLRRVKTDDDEKLRYLGELGLVPGVALKVINRAPFNGPLRIMANRDEHVIGVELAQTLRVELMP